MKKLLLFLPFVFIVGATNAQILKKIADKIDQKVNQRADQKVDQKIDEALDKAEGKTKVKTADGKIKDETDADGETKSKVKGNTAGLQAYSKYDFVQGEKVIAYEDFARTDVGDFPTNWNTNGSAEVVTLNQKEGKWLKINKQGVWLPEFITNLPENFTLEFDLGASPGFSSDFFNVNFGNPKDRDKDYADFNHYTTYRYGYAVQLQLRPHPNGVRGEAHITGSADGNYNVNNEAEIYNWYSDKDNFAHVSMWRQGQRLRVYLNGAKLFDLPKAFPAESKFNMVNFAFYGANHPEDYYILGNLRLAVGAPDTRSKLITEGRFVTSGILFDANSDKLKPESYGVLKQIADALSENANVKVKIIGHTDSDGEDAKNLDLSKRRAASVKIALSTEFKIDPSRMETDGMGESKPIAANTTAEGKAQNRRVEFVKM